MSQGWAALASEGPWVGRGERGWPGESTRRVCWVVVAWFGQAGGQRQEGMERWVGKRPEGLVSKYWYW